MPNDTEERLLVHPEFWKRMEENSKLVKRMPQWMKGSPVNRRMSESVSHPEEPKQLAKSADR